MSQRKSSPWSVLSEVARAVTAPIRWIRESESDVDGTYPGRREPTGPESATHGSVITNLTGMGNG